MSRRGVRDVVVCGGGVVGAACALALARLGLDVVLVEARPPEAWDAAAPERSQVFMLIGVAITLPLILGYTAWAYWVFRGKVGDEGYH